MSEIQKYKVCPACGEHNDPRLMECDTCGTDLMGIPIVDVRLEQKNEEFSDNAHESNAGAVFVRLCECGHVNPPQARKCEKCGEDISDIIPTEQISQKEQEYILCEAGGSYIFPVLKGVSVIGRECGMKEFLQTKKYVSRTHAKLILDTDGLFIENLSRTNYTYVNNVRIQDGKVALKCGDEISLGGITADGNRQEQAAYFVVGTMK